MKLCAEGNLVFEMVGEWRANRKLRLGTTTLAISPLVGSFTASVTINALLSTNGILV
jgi:hypothetical protein